MDSMEIRKNVRKNVRKISVEELKALIDGEPVYVQPSDTTLTVCHLKTTCGIVLTGNSGCLNPDDFDAEIGKKIAYDNAFNQLWQLEGYARLRVFVDGLEKADVAKPIDGEDPWHMRLRFEHDQLVERLDKLSMFIYSEAFDDLGEGTRSALENQRMWMAQYADVLVHRLGVSE